jgi:hypothetical protein
MSASLDFAPLLPWPALAGFGLVALAMLGLALARGLPGGPWRALAALVILTALANPVLREETRDALPDVVIALVDTTASQGMGDRRGQTDRALAHIEAAIERLPNAELRVARLRDAPPGSGGGTEAMAALAQAAADVPRDQLAGAVLITDGRIHDMDRAPDFPAPVHSLLTGSPDDWDLRIEVENAPAFAIVDEPVPLRLRVEAAGDAPLGPGETVELELSVGGAPVRRAQVRPGEPVELTLTLPTGGENLVQFRVPPRAGEITDRNNTAIVTVNGIRDRLRVLLVSGEPHAGERTWRNLLKADSAVDLVHFTILRPPEKQDGVPVSELSLIAFPTRELFLEKIEDFDLIIFDRYQLRGLLPGVYLESVRDYVRNGGAVLVAAGPRICRRRQPGAVAAGPGVAGLADRAGDRDRLSPGADRYRPAPSGHRRAGRRLGGRGRGRGRAGLGPLVPPCRGDTRCRRHGDDRRGRPALADPRPGRSGTGGAVGLGPCLAVASRL